MFNWVAHELKTPLSAARMTVELMRRETTAGGQEKAARRLDSLMRQLDRMESMIASVLDAGRLAEGRVTLDRRPHDFAELMTGIVAYWRESCPDCEFAFTPPGGPLMLDIDANRVREVMNNLLSNAVKYSGAPKRVEVLVRVAPATVEVDVKDFGIGIEAAELSRIFKRFHRAEGESSPGHGLGLFIASALTRLHGGSLRVKSEPGRGSTFTLVLPRVTR
jgi:signal transduction histidine kinase